jgi:hypothetical protein
MPARQLKRFSPPQRASTVANPNIPFLKALTRDASSPRGRFEIYGFLQAVYRVYVGWKRQGMAKQSARALAMKFSVKSRKGTSPIRILIEASFPNADHKQKSRWVRALEYIYSQEVPANQFRKFVRKYGGLAGCARMAVSLKRKRRRPRRDCPEGDWSD